VVEAGAIEGDPERGRVSYDLQVADLDTPGLYDVHFVATIPGLGVQTFPEGEPLLLLVLP
jgi:hypothetical protein